MYTMLCVSVFKYRCTSLIGTGTKPCLLFYTAFNLPFSIISVIEITQFSTENFLCSIYTLFPINQHNVNFAQTIPWNYESPAASVFSSLSGLKFTLRYSRDNTSACRVGSGMRNLQQRATKSEAVSNDSLWPGDT